LGSKGDPLNGVGGDSSLKPCCVTHLAGNGGGYYLLSILNGGEGKISFRKRKEKELFDAPKSQKRGPFGETLALLNGTFAELFSREFEG